MDRLRSFFSAADASKRADALLVTHLPNVAYLCGFTGSSGALLVEASSATLFTDSRYTFQAREQVHDAKTAIVAGSLLKAVAEALKRRRGVVRLGYSPAQLTVAQRASLDVQLGKKLRWADATNAVERLRSIKDSRELATMRDAARLIDAVWAGALRHIKPGVPELNIAAEIEYAMKRKGASGPSFETIVASGARSAWAHARPSSKLLRKNELVVMDQGAILRGYCSDMTRTVFLGRASSRIRSMYRAVLHSQEAAKAAIRAGVTAGSVDAAARDTLKEHRLDRFFTHSTGHGLGTEVHEMPRLGRGEETVLEKGMVITVEPGVYVEGLGGVRIEDDVIVTASGCESLTNANRELIEL
jgi:Xaa-Pro aminopeptidase